MFGKTQSFNFKKVRSKLKLSGEGRFRNLPLTEKEREDAEKNRDISARKKKGAKGTYALRAILGESYDELAIEQLDEAMAKIAFRETHESIERGLKQTGLPQKAISQLMQGVEDNAFGFATGAAHISAKACRNILPGFEKGLVYSDACKEAGYNHAAPEMSPFVRLRQELQGASLTEKRKAIIAILVDKDKSPINSPIARKAAIEAIKQFVTLCHEHHALAGRLPGQVNIELAREVGKSAEERAKLTAGLKNRNTERDRLEGQFLNTFGRKPQKSELRVYELAQEQGWKCLYTDSPIDPKKLFDGTSYQIDHILPWSRFGDNSFINLTLCTAWANQNKKSRTPYEWMDEEGLDWESYVARVESRPGGRCPHGIKGLKKKNYLLKDAKDKEEAFRTRNMNDTKWAAKVILQAIEALYPIELNEKGNPIRRVRARNGAVTSFLRRGWGLEGFKKDKDGNRKRDDRHHAVDAMVVAATSEKMLNRLTRAFQESEKLGKPRHFEQLAPPWPTFREQVKGVYEAITCSRSERRRARGEGHEATIRAYSPEKGLVFVRETPEELIKGLVKKVDGNLEKLEALIAEKFVQPERSKTIIRSIAKWALAGAPKENPPLGPTNDPIRRVRIIDRGIKPAVMLSEKATANRSITVRVDVFSKRDKSGGNKFYLVPIYTHQVMNKRDYPLPPDRAIRQSKEEDEWEKMTADYLFRFSLHPFCWLELTTKNKAIEGYYRGTNRATGQLIISPHFSLHKEERVRVGARFLRSFKKYSVDRLGERYEIKAEPRIWHGEVCISAIQPD
jgi:CRISPR-associated endonuclease Csn1